MTGFVSAHYKALDGAGRLGIGYASQFYRGHLSFDMRFAELISVLQLAIGPVILISGIGLLLLSMTNRFGRVIDRARQIADAARRAGPGENRYVAQMEMLHRRANLLRLAIIFAVTSVLLAAFLVITLFITALLQSNTAVHVVILFLGCMVLLILSLIAFLLDLNLSLEAMRLDTAMRSEP
jgi:hypothetical protein